MKKNVLSLLQADRSKSLFKRLSLGFLAVLILSTIAFSLSPQKALAESKYESVDKRLAQEYKTWASFNFIAQCMRWADASGKFGVLDKANSQAKYKDSKYFFPSLAIEVSNVLASGKANWGCGDNDSLVKALKNVGYTSSFEFANEYFKDDGKCSTVDGSIFCPHIPRNEMLDKIQERIKKMPGAIDGPDNSINKLSPAAIYWFWKYQFLTTCDAKHFDSLKDLIEKSSRKPTQKNVNGDTNVSETMSVPYIEKGVVKVYRWFSFNKDKELDIQELGFLHKSSPYQTSDLSYFSSENADCIDMGQHMSDVVDGKAIFVAYEEAVQKAIEKCKQAGSDEASCKQDADKETQIGGTTPEGSSSTGGTDASDSTSCEETGGKLSWIMCPVVFTIDSGLSAIDNLLLALLKVDDNKYADNTNLYKAWSQFRNIGLTILIAAMLVMVISTALGVGAFDAYTVKKAFPRMVAAIMFMLLSWYICVFLIDFTNTIGSGVLGLMTSPFGSGANSLSSLFAPSAAQGAIAAGAVAGTGLLALVAVFNSAVLITLLSWLGTALLIMMVAFITLIARQMFVIVLILGSPIAILSWIFPGNDKLWKLWWQSFSKLLLMFPMIMALIASGRIFAGASNGLRDAGLEGAIVDPLIKLTAYVIPYIFIPFTFKAAGGAFGSIAGMVNDRSKGGFDRLKNLRKGQREKMKEGVQSGTFLRNNNDGRFRRGLNNRIEMASYAGKAGMRPSKMRAMSALGTLHHAEELLEKNDAIKAISSDDDLVRAMRDAKGRAAIEKHLADTGRFARGSAEMNQAIAMVQAAQSAGNQESLSQVAVMALAASGTGFDTHADMYKAINDAAGDNSGVQGALLAKARGLSERARRPALASPGHVDQAKAMNDLKNGASAQNVNAKMRKAAFGAGSIHQIVSGRTNDFKQLTNQIASDYKAAEASGNVEAMVQAASEITSLRSAMGSASEDNRKVFSELLDAVEVKSTIPMSVEGQLATKIAQRAAPTVGTAPTQDQVNAYGQNLAQEIRTRAGGFETSPGVAPTAEQRAQLQQQEEQIRREQESQQQQE